jgi:hypothetical protein
MNSEDGKLYDNIVRAIEMAYNARAKQAHFAEITFLYGETIDIVSDRKDWCLNLMDAIEYFETVQEFEKCYMIKKLMEKINGNEQGE